MSLGNHEPDAYSFTLDDTPQAQFVGTVRLTAAIKYGHGDGARFCDITVEQADALALELVRKAEDARDYVRRAEFAAEQRREKV